jgi:hypothetical protein
VITINAPTAQAYLHPIVLTLDFAAVDPVTGTTPPFAPPSGVKVINATLDGAPVASGQKFDLYTMPLGSSHTLTVTAADYYGNTSTQSVTFNVTTTVQGLMISVNRFFQEGGIDNAGIRNSLLSQLSTAQAYLNQGKTKQAINALNAFMNLVQAQSGKHISKTAANLLLADAKWVIAHPK